MLIDADCWVIQLAALYYYQVCSRTLMQTLQNLLLYNTWTKNIYQPTATYNQRKGKFNMYTLASCN